MSENRILFVAQEINPYLPSNEISQLCRKIPQALLPNKYEARTFMPKFGTINERRNQLHEVIRLSGINISINDNDHPLIIKVASMQPSRIQVYFIDNDDYFQKDESDVDPYGSNREDNDERLVFFGRGTLETAKKLNWTPTVMHFAGWFTSLLPLYLSSVYSDEPAFKGAKIVYSIFDSENEVTLNEKIFDNLKAEGVSAKRLSKFKDLNPDIKLLHKLAISHSDGIVFHGENPDPELIEYAKAEGKPFIQVSMEESDGKVFHEFYKSL